MTQPVRAAGHSPYLMSRLEWVDLYLHSSVCLCSNNCTWDMYSTTSSHLISSCCTAGAPVPWPVHSLFEADWEGYCEVWDWLWRARLYLRSAYGHRIRYPLWQMEGAHCTMKCVCPHDTVHWPHISSPSTCYWSWCQYTVNITVKFSFPPKFQRPAFLPLDPHCTKTLVFSLNLTRLLVWAGCNDRNICWNIMWHCTTVLYWEVSWLKVFACNPLL